MSIFSSLQIGKLALRAQYKGMEVSGQNVANANTPGYSRQRVNLVAVVPGISPGVNLAPGRGVKVAGVERIHSEFYRTQLMNTASHLSYWIMRQETYRGVEVIFMEPGEYGLNQYLGDFFDAWSELSSSAESTAIRTGLLERAETFTRAVQDTYLRLTELRFDLRDEIGSRVQQVNQLAKEIAVINDKILFSHALKQTSNELLDQLDLALEELSGLIDIRVFRKENGAVDVFAGGSLLVQNQNTYAFDVEMALDGTVHIVNHHGTAVEPQSGRLFGLLQGVNETIPEIQAQIDQLVSSLVEEVNRLHRGGYNLYNETGINFFKEIEDNGVPPSLQFALNEELAGDPSRIAAASEGGQPGNGLQALEISRLRSAPVMNEGKVSMIDYYRGLVASIGVKGQESTRMVEAFTKAETQLREEHLAVAGVSLDEEVMNMIQFQHAWHAAARFISYVDYMIGTLIDELGR